ncbi:MAG: Uma2 family endonuclease [Bryobacteraceae bacterium]
MPSHPVTFLTPEQYLELERAVPEKHEYIDGKMVAMAGGSPAHSMIATNLIRKLPLNTGGRNCQIFTSDLRVSVHWSRLITYPDVTVVCGKPEYADEKRDTVTNPTMLVEVLSPSTEGHDRGKKADLYRFIPSLREFLLIDQSPVMIDHYRRLPDGTWQIVALRDISDVLQLDSLGCSFPVSEVYEGLDGL